MLWRVQTDRSQFAQFLEQQGKGQSSTGLPSHNLLARLLESQPEPPYPLLQSKLLSNVLSFPSKGLKAALWLTAGCARFARCDPDLQCCVCHSDSNLCSAAERSLENRIVEEILCTYMGILPQKPANKNEWIKGELLVMGFPQQSL